MIRKNIQWFVDCVPPNQQAGYARVLGILPQEIEVVAQHDGVSCEGLIWRVRRDLDHL